MAVASGVAVAVVVAVGLAVGVDVAVAVAVAVGATVAIGVAVALGAAVGLAVGVDVAVAVAVAVGTAVATGVAVALGTAVGLAVGVDVAVAVAVAVGAAATSGVMLSPEGVTTESSALSEGASVSTCTRRGKSSPSAAVNAINAIIPIIIHTFLLRISVHPFTQGNEAIIPHRAAAVKLSCKMATFVLLTFRPYRRSKKFENKYCIFPKPLL